MTTTHWITSPGQKPDNYTFLARKQFTLDCAPAKAMLRVCADSRYALYVNGQFVGAGPAKSSHKRYFYDSYDAAKELRAGTNHLAVEVHCPVQATFIAAPVAPALWLQLDDLVGTDSSWQARPDPSRRSDAPLYTKQTGFSELRDLRKDLAGWQIFADGEAGWTQAEVLSAAHELGGRLLVARDIPLLGGGEFVPMAMVDSGGVPCVEEAAENETRFADRIHSELHFHAEFPKFEPDPGHASNPTHLNPLRIVPSQTGRGGYCILDFERPVLGSVLLDIEAPEGAIMDLGYSESLVGGRVLTKRFDYRFADRYILRGGRQRIEKRLHDRGFRFLQLVLRRFNQPIQIHSLTVSQRAYPIPVEAAFECDDPFLNQLWAMCRTTIAACCTDTFIDCPWREQAFWINDALVVNVFYLSLTSDRLLPARCLRLGADGQLPNGLIPAVYPSKQKTVFPSMPTIWAIILSDYYLYTNDLALARELLPVMDKGLAIYDTWLNADGLTPDQPEMWNFIDWGYHADTAALGGVSAILNLLIAAAYKRAAFLHEAAKNGARAAELKEKSRQKVAAIIRRFWLADQKMFYDCTEPPSGKRSFSQHPHAVGLHFGLFAEPQRSAALNALLDPSLVQAEFYYQHFVLSALARHGRAAQALAIIRDRWGGMAREGSRTVWEAGGGPDAFNGCGSLCHGFSCAPLYFMQTTLLGVSPLRPGFAEFRLEPRSLGLQSCQGRAPTPHGDISVSWKQRGDGWLLVEINIPRHTVAVLADGRRLQNGRHAVTLKN